MKKGTLLAHLLVLSSISQINAEKRILVAGGAGFIGSQVAAVLLERGDSVTIIDSLNDYYDPMLKQHNLSIVQQKDKYNRLHIYHEDICNKQQLHEIFEREHPEVVFHCAAYAGVRPSIQRPELYLKTNIMGTFNLLEMAKIFKVQNFVFASSSSVYGETSNVPFEEIDVADRPCSPYAATKRAGELLVYTYHHLYNFPCTCLRFFTVYGPRGRVDMAPFKFLDAIHKGKPIIQYGDGQRMRDFTYIDDLVDGIINAIDKPFDFEVFNLGGGNPITLQNFIRTIEKVTHKKATIIMEDVPPGDVRLTHASIKKAQTMLGYNPQMPFNEGIKKTYYWYLNEYLPLTQGK